MTSLAAGILDKAIARHVGPDATSWVSKTERRDSQNPRTGRQVVALIPQATFCIFQPRAIGSTKGTYLDMLGAVCVFKRRVKGGSNPERAVAGGEATTGYSLPN